MRNFVVKFILFVVSIMIMFCSTNYFIDPANIFHTGLEKIMAEQLEKNKIIYNPGNIDEGKFNEARLNIMKNNPEIVIIGSSHVMYQPWNFKSCYVAGLSGAYLGDYYAIVGLLDECKKNPRKIIIGVDPWSFITSANEGRHTSLKKYSQNTYNKIYNSTDHEKVNFLTKKQQELFKVSYFQESLRALRKNGFKYYFFNRDKVDISVNIFMEERSKITPNSRRIFSNKEYYDVSKNDSTSISMINNQSIYQVGGGYIDLPMDNLKEFIDLVKYLQRQKIIVEFYLHPWYPTIYDYFESDVKYSGVIKLEQYIRKVARINNIEVHGSYDYKICKVKKEDFADWLHLKADKMLESYNIVCK